MASPSKLSVSVEEYLEVLSPRIGSTGSNRACGIISIWACGQCGFLIRARRRASIAPQGNKQTGRRRPASRLKALQSAWTSLLSLQKSIDLDVLA